MSIIRQRYLVSSPDIIEEEKGYTMTQLTQNNTSEISLDSHDETGMKQMNNLSR